MQRTRALRSSSDAPQRLKIQSRAGPHLVHIRKMPAPNAPTWHILTGEYPPDPGGVSDYSYSVARGLAAAGDSVHVWAPDGGAGPVDDFGVERHSLSFGFRPAVDPVAELSQAVQRGPGPARVLLQYVPQAFGAKAMNMPLCVRLAMLRRAQVWIMFHEVALGWAPLKKWRRNGVAAMHRLMANVLLARADRVFVSIPGWETMLREMAPFWRGTATWSPIPSNLPTEVPIEASQEVRARLPLRGYGKVLGHFGTYGPGTAQPLKRALTALLKADSSRIALLVGRGGEGLAKELVHEPTLTGRVAATGGLTAKDAAAHLRACDVLVQPYADGVSTRRTSVMAGLALGIPMATNEGNLTEPVWRQSGAVTLAASSEELASAVEALLADSDAAARLADRGRALYALRFSVDRTIERLRDKPPQSAL